MSFRTVIALDDLWIGDMQAFVVAGTRVLLVRLEDRLCAYEDRCAHLGFALSGGRLEGGVIRCPAHHYEYDARTGRGRNPKTVSLRQFPVRLLGNMVAVDTEGGAA